MMEKQREEEVADRILEAATAFAHENHGDPGMSHTFGYFTDHPVADLNRKRLIMTLEETVARLAPPAPVLDMGCGGGLFTAALALCGYRVAGVDLAPEEIARAERFAERLEASPALFAGDLQKEDWIDDVTSALGGKPGLLFYGYCLHHLPAVEAHLEMMGRWLPEGTIVVVNEENPRSPSWFLKNAVRSVIQRDTKEEHQLSYPRWSAMMARAGFEPAGKLRGADMIPGVPPSLSWSQVFSYRRTSEVR